MERIGARGGRFPVTRGTRAGAGVISSTSSTSGDSVGFGPGGLGGGLRGGVLSSISR